MDIYLQSRSRTEFLIISPRNSSPACQMPQPSPVCQNISSCFRKMETSKQSSSSIQASLSLPIFDPMGSLHALPPKDPLPTQDVPSIHKSTSPKSSQQDLSPDLPVPGATARTSPRHPACSWRPSLLWDKPIPVKHNWDEWSCCWRAALPEQHLNHASLSYPFPISFPSLSHPIPIPLPYCSHPIPIHHYIPPAPVGVITPLTTPQAVSIHGSRSLPTPLLSLSLSSPTLLAGAQLMALPRKQRREHTAPRGSWDPSAQNRFWRCEERKRWGGWRGWTRCCFETHVGSMSAGIPTQSGRL